MATLKQIANTHKNRVSDDAEWRERDKTNVNKETTGNNKNESRRVRLQPLTVRIGWSPIHMHYARVSAFLSFSAAFCECSSAVHRIVSHESVEWLERALVHAVGLHVS